MKISRKQMIDEIKIAYWRDYICRENELQIMSDEKIREIYNSVVAQRNYIHARNLKMWKRN